MLPVNRSILRRVLERSGGTLKGVLSFLFCVAALQGVPQAPVPASESPFLCNEADEVIALEALAAAVAEANGGRGRGAVPVNRGKNCASIEGVVEREGSNNGIPYAEVTLQFPNIGPAGDVLTVKADSKGHFIFPSIKPLPLPDGYNIAAAADGYVSTLYGQTSLSSTGENISVTRGQNRTLTIKLTPAPAIGGLVTTADSKPVAAALVRAYRIQYTPVGRRMKIVAKGLTNDRGAYRLLGIAPGDYYVSASYNEDARAVPFPGTLLTPNLSAADPGYVTTFFPSAEAPADAAAFTVTPGGARNDQTITLKESERFKLHVSVVANAASPSETHAFNIALLPDGADLGDVEDYVVHGNGTSEFDIRNVGRGHYSLVAFDKGRILSEAVHVDIQHDQNITISVYDPVDIPGTVVNEDGDVVISNYRIRSKFGSTDCQPSCMILDSSDLKPVKLRARLVRTDPGLGQTIYADVDAGHFNIQDVGPGEYDVYVDGFLPGVYVKEVEFRNPDPNWFGRIRVEPDKPPRILDPITLRWRIDSGIRIVMASAKPYVTGIVWTGGKKLEGPIPVPGALVLFEPFRQPGNPFTFREDRFFVTHADGGGHFEMSLPVGKYVAFGFEQIPSDLYFDPEFNARIFSFGAITDIKLVYASTTAPIGVMRMIECENKFIIDAKDLQIELNPCILRVPREQSSGLYP